MIGDPGFHRGSHAQGLVNATEVVPCEVERDRCFQVVEFLGERIRESRETAQVHPQTQI